MVSLVVHVSEKELDSIPETFALHSALSCLSLSSSLSCGQLRDRCMNTLENLNFDAVCIDDDDDRKIFTVDMTKSSIVLDYNNSVLVGDLMVGIEVSRDKRLVEICFQTGGEGPYVEKKLQTCEFFQLNMRF